MRFTRRSQDRGRAQVSWLDSRHTFSFGDYHDPQHMGFGVLRVINEDRVAPGGGFPTHPHRDMEIVSYVLEGALEHKDSMGNGSIIAPGEIQYMSAGPGVVHSEYNASKSQPVHFYQIWIIPPRRGTPSRYAQLGIDEAARRDAWGVLASPDGRAGSIPLEQDALILSSVLSSGAALSYAPSAGRRLWLQVARGSVETSSLEGAPGERLEAGDALAMISEPLQLNAQSAAELLLFDLPG